MQQLRLFVGGMSCRRCVREVTARLRDVPGVQTVSANPADYTVQLSGSMHLSDVLAAFTGTSYQPRADDDACGGTARASGDTESEGPAGDDSGGTAVGKSAT